VPETVLIDSRFCGPPDSANGGYACGLVGALVGGAAEVTLRSPPPLDQPLAVERSPDGVRIRLGEQLVAEARPTTLDVEPPPPPTLAEASAASRQYPWGGDTHPYPTCFVCGPRRTPGDGLCVYPGPVDGRPIAAAPYVPDDTVVDENGRMRPEIVWAALDCPSWFGFNCFHEMRERVLLGRLAARIYERPRAGEPCICVGWFIGRDGRKIHCGSALYAASGALLALGRATWITLR
jgi:hypothetical protein